MPAVTCATRIAEVFVLSRDAEACERLEEHCWCVPVRLLSPRELESVSCGPTRGHSPGVLPCPGTSAKTEMGLGSATRQCAEFSGDSGSAAVLPAALSQAPSGRCTPEQRKWLPELASALQHSHSHPAVDQLRRIGIRIAPHAQDAEVSVERRRGFTGALQRLCQPVPVEDKFRIGG